MKHPASRGSRWTILHGDIANILMTDMKQTT
ncbi:MAG: hypothetical protein ACI9Y1_001633 [Lentisphaeria bacterium]|jgi:hypothetical protein